MIGGTVGPGTDGGVGCGGGPVVLGPAGIGGVFILGKWLIALLRRSECGVPAVITEVVDA